MIKIINVLSDRQETALTSCYFLIEVIMQNTLNTIQVYCTYDDNE